MTETRTLDLALERFTLVTGTQGSEADMTACAASLLSWVDGGPFTDHPTCAHPIINNLVIRAFDASTTTDDERVQIVRAGLTGMLNTWDIPTEVVVMAHSRTEPGEDPRRLADLCLDVLGAITWWKSDKQRPNLYGADLSRAYLTGANLSRANLYGADLTGANLYGADLTGANLYGAYLTGANLYGADLTGANLYGAYLTGADLSRAYLSGANLSRADLYGADLSGADLTGANLYGAYGVKLPAGWELSPSWIAQRTTEVAS